MDVRFTLNGEERAMTVAPGESLLELLRRQGYVGTKHGCEDGTCGVCTVLLDGMAVHACILLAPLVDGRTVTTIEGIGTRERLHPLQAAFVEAGAIQCGYCTPGLVLSAVALLGENHHPSEAEVREALQGVLCRCTGHVKPVEAVLRVAGSKGG